MKKTFLYILLMVITATVFGQNVYVVTKTTDPNPFTDKFNNDDALCDPDMYGTLQWAINKVNYNGGESRIEFNIPGTGVHEISSNSYFPQIKNPVVIDGTTQAGYTTGSPVVKITGQMKTQYGFNVYNTTVTIKGLEISNFARSAIMLNECSNSKIIDNKIYNISFSGGYGLHILACNYTEIYGNRIEIDALPEYGRSSVGIYIDKCSYCTIGGTETGKANIIANCQKVGVVINSDKYNKVSGNSIYNNPKAIQLGSTANDNIQPPVITSYTNGILSGTALPNSIVEVFGSTGAENANEYLVSVVADEHGEWSVEVIFNCDYTLASQTSNNLNTSSFAIHRLDVLDFNFNCNSENHEPCNMICNGSFSWDDYNFTDPGLYGYGYNVTPNGWDCTHGSSDWCPNHDDVYDKCERVAPSPGYDYLHIWSAGPDDYPENQHEDQDDNGSAHPFSGSEGVITQFVGNFVPGAKYKLSFIVASSKAVEHFYIKLVNTSYLETEINNFRTLIDPNNDHPEYTFMLPPINDALNKCKTIYECSFPIPLTNWNNVSFEIPATSEFLNFDGLWIYSTNDNNLPIGRVYLDDITLYQSSPQQEASVLTGTCIEEGSPIQLSVYDPNAMSYNWSGPNGWIGTGAQPIVTTSATTANAGVYTVTVTDLLECSFTSSVTVHHHQININIPDDINICIGSSTEIGSNQLANSGGYPNTYFEYSWSPTSSLVGYNSSNPVATPTQAETYTVTVTSNYGCSETASITVNPIFPIPEVTATNNSPLCTGTTLMLSCNSPTATSYSWRHQPTTWYSEIQNPIRESVNFYPDNPDLIFNYVGNYSVTVTDVNGCTNSATTEVIIDPYIDPGNIVVYNNGTYCSGNQGEDIAIMSYDYYGYSASYVWSNPDYSHGGFGIPLSRQWLWTDDSGTYTVTVTSVHGCTGTASAEIVVNPSPLAQESLSFTDYFCAGDDITFSSSYTGTGMTYIWQGPQDEFYFDESTLIQNSTYLNSGDYQVTITNEYECSDEAGFSMIMMISPVIETHVTHYSNGSNEGVALITLSSGLENVMSPSSLVMRITDENGQLVYTHPTSISWSSLPMTIPVTGLSSGDYTINVTTTRSVIEHSCDYSTIFTMVDMPPVASLDALHVNCQSGSVITMAIYISGGASPYVCQIFSHCGYNGGIIDEYVFNEEGLHLIYNDNQDLFGCTFGVRVTDANEMQYFFSPLNNDLATSLTSSNIHNNELYLNEAFVIGESQDRTLIVSENVEFKDCRIYTISNIGYENIENYWTVERGATMLLNNTIVTPGCPDQMWDGIIVQGDWGVATGVPDPGPAQLIMKNNSIIEYAKKAVYSDWNGVVKISDSKFVNCPIGVELASYDNQALEWSTLPNLKPRAYVYRSEFITDNNFIETPESHINIYNVDNIYLKGNKYLNTTATSDLSGIERGKGIFAINSSFSVIENRHLSNIPDVPMSAEDKSYFDGLYYGIQAENTTAQSIKIRNCEFLNYDRIGAYLKNFNALTITTNIFDSYEFMEEAGLYLEGCNAYHVENNKFYDWTFGLIVNNSGTTANEIYRNSFFNNSYSLNAYHTNANLNGSTGLFIHCNKFNNSNSHFDSNILVAEGKVKREQGYLHPTNSQYNVSASNLFSKTMLSGAKAFTTYSSPLDYIYYCNIIGDVTDITGFTSSNVTVDQTYRDYTESATCPSELPGTHWINPDMEISAITNDITTLQNNINSFVDGGNTSVVLQKVQNLKPNNFNKTCAELLNISPYLSDTVLVSFIQTSVNGHTIAKTNVLLANSPLPDNALAELENMNLPMPHKNTIYMYQSGTNPVILKQREIDELVFHKELLVNDYVRYGLQSDSLAFAKDSLISYLSAQNNYQAKCILIPILVYEKKYNDAQTQINELIYIASSENPLLQSELNDFAELQELIIITDSCKTIDDYRSVVQSRLDLVQRIAYDLNHRCRAQAQTMLTIAGLDEFEPEFIYPIEDRYLEVGSVQQIGNTSFDLNDLVEVYPNPASKEIWIEYLMIKDKPVSKIEIFNIQGQLILTQNIRNGFGVEQVDVSDLSEGNYIIKLGEFSKKISVMK